MCRHRSIPAARPAEVSTSPSSTNSTFSSTSTSGCIRRIASANIQWVVAGRPSSSPAAASTKAPVQIDTRRVPGRIRASAAAACGVEHTVGARGRIPRAGDHDGVGRRQRLRACAGHEVEAGGRGTGPGVSAARHHVVERAAVGVGGGGEQRRRDGGVEPDDGRQAAGRDAMHAHHFGMFLTNGGIHATGRAVARAGDSDRVTLDRRRHTHAAAPESTGPGWWPPSASSRSSARRASARCPA